MNRQNRLFIFAAVFAVVAGCKKKAPPPMMPEVSVVTLQSRPVTLGMELPGRVVPVRVADVRPQANGVILKRLFTEGTNVEAGQPLYQIDPSQYRATYETARANVERASATLVASSALLGRYKGLIDSNAVSKQEYDNAVAAQMEASANLASAKAALESARVSLVYTDVLAPIAGRIGRSSVTEGALVTANQDTPLATIQQLNSVYVDIVQPSLNLLKLQKEYASGRLKSAGKNQAVATLTLEDGSPYPLKGRLGFAETTVDPESGSVTLRATFPNPDRILLPGMFVQVHLQQGVDENALLIPQRAVTRDQRGEPTALFVGVDNKVELRTLKADRAINDDWLITDGAKAGDRVIVEGLQKVRPGMQVKATEFVAPPTNDGSNGAPASSAETPKHP
jgi:membrane fusion protein (multidrug efflux system)